jgi:hypothetical protein
MQNDTFLASVSDQVSLRATAPVLSRPTAPFDKTERKRAHTSECSLRGIKPVLADAAASHAQGTYDKWWVNTRATPQLHFTEPPVPFPKPCPPNKRRKIRGDDSSLGVVTAEGSHDLSNAQTSDDGSLRNTTQSREASSITITHISTFTPIVKEQIEAVKGRLIDDLKASGGSEETREFQECLDILSAYYNSKSWDGRGISDTSPFTLNGSWVALSKPTYDGCKEGRNEKGEYLYTLGRLSFDMFTPANLVCSIQGSFNYIQPIDPKTKSRPLYVPRRLMKEIHRGCTNLRAYEYVYQFCYFSIVIWIHCIDSHFCIIGFSIVVALTIEAQQDRKGAKMTSENDDYIVPRPIRAILTNQGYTVPDPTVPDRLSVWFSGGSLKCLDEASDLDEWKRLFDSSCAPNRDLREYANILAAKLLLGALLPEEMNEDGTMSFALKRPIGGHGCAYCDILYLDNTLRITRGHHGSVYVFAKVPEPDTVHSV